ncbi:unnamed protein product [Tenebrio molitor]|nr:unnamed protein product [Tenebrio molitor]
MNNKRQIVSRLDLTVCSFVRTPNDPARQQFQENVIFQFYWSTVDHHSGPRES